MQFTASKFSIKVLRVIGLLQIFRNSSSSLKSLGNSPNKLFKNSSAEIGFPSALQNEVEIIDCISLSLPFRSFIFIFGFFRIGSPGSEIVKLGSALTQWSDILPRVALYQHLKGKGKTEEEAIIESLDNFIDYKMNMPPEIKFFSDTFFLMYPSFWMKIQKVIFNLGKNHPASLGAALLLTEVLDLGQLHILESSVFNKYGSGSLWDVPEARDLTFFWFNLA